MQPEPRRRERWAPSWSLILHFIRGLVKSEAKRSTSAIYIKIPAEAELKMPSTISAVAPFSLYTLDIPIPIPIPVGVVSEKKSTIVAIAFDLNFAWQLYKKIYSLLLIKSFFFFSHNYCYLLWTVQNFFEHSQLLLVHILCLMHILLFHTFINTWTKY